MISNPNPVMLAAHRGDRAHFPENTMPAFESALKMPIDQIELDLHMTKDGQIMIMHDHALERTTNGEGLISAHTWAEIRALDAGSHKGPEFAGTRVPLFEELLERVQDFPQMTLDVELKDYPETDVEFAHESADKAIALLRKYNMEDKILINAWSARLLEYVDEKYAHAFPLHGYYPVELYRSAPTRDPKTYLTYAALFAVKGDTDPVRPKADFDQLIADGIIPCVYYPDQISLECYDRVLPWGVKVITADDPMKALNYLREKGLHA